ncbi:xanthine permease [candidate division WWE3 bacterium]|nr:xanthine permease [candidate division WWE3 bacterium]
MQAKSPSLTGYLPNDAPNYPALFSLAFQHVLTMFPATVLVAILTGFDIGVTLFASGLATVVALLGSKAITGSYIPLYYGSSFSYIAAVSAVVASNGSNGIQVAQVGIIGTAVINILIGIAVRQAGKKRLDAILPPIITGSVSIVIGLALARTALDMSAGTCCLVNMDKAPMASGAWWTVATITLLATILFSVYLRGKGFWGMIPVLLGALVGYLVAIPFGLVNFGPVFQAPLLQVPHFTVPAFTSANGWWAVLAIAPIAIATIPESTAHLYQIGLYVDRLADEAKRPQPQLSRWIGVNLVLDGIGDLINGLLGGCAGTNYGENNSLMAITRNYSGPVLLGAGVLAMILSFVGTLSAIVATLPTAVTGGLAIYLFGIIGLQGVALMMSEKVDLFDPRQLAIGAAILVIGIGGNSFAGGALPFGSFSIPAIATSAVVGIVLNAIFRLMPSPTQTTA